MKQYISILLLILITTPYIPAYPQETQPIYTFGEGQPIYLCYPYLFYPQLFYNIYTGERHTNYMGETAEKVLCSRDTIAVETETSIHIIDRKTGATREIIAGYRIVDENNGYIAFTDNQTLFIYSPYIPTYLQYNIQDYKDLEILVIDGTAIPVYIDREDNLWIDNGYYKTQLNIKTDNIETYRDLLATHQNQQISIYRLDRIDRPKLSIIDTIPTRYPYGEVILLTEDEAYIRHGLTTIIYRRDGGIDILGNIKLIDRNIYYNNASDTTYIRYGDTWYAVDGYTPAVYNNIAISQDGLVKSWITYILETDKDTEAYLYPSGADKPVKVYIEAGRNEVPAYTTLEIDGKHIYIDRDITLVETVEEIYTETSLKTIYLDIKTITPSKIYTDVEEIYTAGGYLVIQKTDNTLEIHRSSTKLAELGRIDVDMAGATDKYLLLKTGDTIEIYSIPDFRHIETRYIPSMENETIKYITGVDNEIHIYTGDKLYIIGKTGITVDSYTYILDGRTSIEIHRDKLVYRDTTYPLGDNPKINQYTYTYRLGETTVYIDLIRGAKIHFKTPYPAYPDTNYIAIHNREEKTLSYIPAVAPDKLCRLTVYRPQEGTLYINNAEIDTNTIYTTCGETITVEYVIQETTVYRDTITINRDTEITITPPEVETYIRLYTADNKIELKYDTIKLKLNNKQHTLQYNQTITLKGGIYTDIEIETPLYTCTAEKLEVIDKETKAICNNIQPPIITIYTDTPTKITIGNKTADIYTHLSTPAETGNNTIYSQPLDNRYTSTETTIYITEGEATVKLTHKIKPTLTIYTEPQQATINIYRQGIPIESGVGYIQLYLEPDLYTVEVYMEGYKTYTQEIYIEEDTELTITLEPEPFTIPQEILAVALTIAVATATYLFIRYRRRRPTAEKEEL